MVALLFRRGWFWELLEVAHELVCTKDRAAALLSGGRPRHLCHVAGPVDDPGDSGGPWPAD
jgi:hypothetical protein